LQASVPPQIFAWSEIAVAACVLALTGSVVLIQNNRRAFFFGLALAIGGTVLVGIALVGLHTGRLSPFAFMVLHGLGLYLPYIAVHTTIFERLIAMTRNRGNIGYLMYLADSFGYLGYVVVLLARNTLGSSENFLSFFLMLSWAIAAACVLLLIPCWCYFVTHSATRSAPDQDNSMPVEAKGVA
jgi:hypothetical protein